MGNLAPEITIDLCVMSGLIKVVGLSSKKQVAQTQFTK